MLLLQLLPAAASGKMSRIISAKTEERSCEPESMRDMVKTPSLRLRRPLMSTYEDPT